MSVIRYDPVRTGESGFYFFWYWKLKKEKLIRILFTNVFFGYNIYYFFYLNIKPDTVIYFFSFRYAFVFFRPNLSLRTKN
jgi:hypothetical protein